MALCASGEISLAGSVVGRSVACELGCSGTGEISMDRADVRALAGRPGAGCAICMCDFYGKSSGPSLGDPLCGGYYMGAVASPANYYIIISPKASGQGASGCAWKTTRTFSGFGAGSCTDGYSNTYNALNSSLYPAGNWTATRSINGYSDWYLPARDELSLLYSGKSCLPIDGAIDNQCYWSSTCTPSPSGIGYALGRNMANGQQQTRAFTGYYFRARAIRRESF